MKNLSANFIYCFIAVVLLFSCAEDGDVGPQGPPGPQGLQGEQGTQGEQGEPGTANVIFSEWVSFESALWSAPFSFFGQNRREYEIEESTITEDILNKGTVAVYVKFGGTVDKIQPLPVLQAITQSKNQVLGFNLEMGNIVLFYHNLNDALDPGTIGTGNSYRYVIIPGGTAVNGKMGGPDMNDYEAVRLFYNLPD